MQEVLLSQIKDKLPLKDISDKRARKIIKKATEKKVADRFGSASEFRVFVRLRIDIDRLNAVRFYTRSIIGLINC